MVMQPDRRTVAERADRWQRRYSGPKIEYVRLWVAWHDLWVHEIARGIVIPILRRLIKRDPA